MSIKTYIMQLGPLESWLNEDSEVTGYQVIGDNPHGYMPETLYLREAINIELADGDNNLHYDRLLDQPHMPIALIRFESSAGNESRFEITFDARLTYPWSVLNTSKSRVSEPKTDTSSFMLFMEAWEEFCGLVSLDGDQAKLLTRIYRAVKTAAKPVGFKSNKPECFGAFS